MELNAATIFLGNWSYRPEEKGLLGLSDDQSFPIVECEDCQFLYAKYEPQPSILKDLYDRVIDQDGAKKNSFSFTSLAHRMKYLATLMRLISDDGKRRTILDFGCGFGPTLYLLAGIPGIEAIGFDSSEIRIEGLALQNVNTTGDVAKLFKYAPFSAVILDNVIEHIAHPKKTLDLIRSCCETDTVLYVSVPDANRKFMSKQRKIFQQGRAVSMEINPWEHLNYFDLESLDRLMSSSGFLPLTAAQISTEIDIGLRPGNSMFSRSKNAVASAIRLFDYVRNGELKPSVNARFYRCVNL